MKPAIPTTVTDTPIACWLAELGAPGPVEIALTGLWDTTTLGLKGSPQPDGNHAKVGVSADPAMPYAIFGDLNQQGALSGACTSSQNGRGGTFYVLPNKILVEGLTDLMKGETAAAAR
jgi:hypothetical protein